MKIKFCTICLLLLGVLLVTSCKDDSLQKEPSFIVGEPISNGYSMVSDTMVLSEQFCWNCYWTISAYESTPIDEVLLHVHYRWRVSPGGTMSSAKHVSSTGVSGIGSVNGEAKSYENGTEVAYASEFLGNRYDFGNDWPFYLTVKVNSSSGEYVGWIKFERQSANILITDFSFVES